MILCPKCGFEQPEDVYCAKCGVNMDTYKGAGSGPQPLVIIFLGLALAIGGFIISKFSGTVSGITQKFNENSINAFEEYERGEIVPQQPQSAPQQKPTPTELLNLTRKENPINTKPLKLSAAKTKPSDSLKAENLAEATPTPEPTAVTTTTLTEAADKISNQMSVRFYLLGRSAVDKARLVMGALSSNSITKALYNEIIKEQSSQAMGSETHTLTPNQPTSFSQGTQEPKTKGYIGFVIDVTPIRISEQQGDYKINIRRSLPEVTNTGELRISVADIQENISIQAGSVTAISGLLNRKQLYENEDMLYRGNILRVFLDPEFQKFEQEFVVFFVP
ncbi:MAG: hypothetical protein IPM57_09025 [Oligoflexia bacterium]|nr:hypothetical protein [Oligoflexia bacterium]